MEVTVRPATPADAPRLSEIYAYYVEHTAVSFEYAAPSAAEFRRRMAAVCEKYPYFVAERGGRVIGYAYAHAFVGRAAYDWSAELTVYLEPSARRQGAGRALYAALEAALGRMGVTNLYACIGVPTQENDPYLNEDSLEFHRRMGFSLVGTFRCCGRKFGRWYDMVWMEKCIAPHRPDCPPVTPYPALPEE
ncbi:MAG: N-acetyltransferase [Clostridia bacterium]|nr:N-acetyltransferase [Clostridia bacterium]